MLNTGRKQASHISEETFQMESAAKKERPDVSPEELKQLQEHEEAFARLARRANAIH